MITTTKTFKSGAWTTFDRQLPSGMYEVKLYARDGTLIDKVRCDDYRNARAYLKSFNKIARTA